jgi:hypothetical protein
MGGGEAGRSCCCGSGRVGTSGLVDRGSGRKVAAGAALAGVEAFFFLALAAAAAAAKSDGVGSGT